jgi:multiple sugar transport system permease protein
VGEIPVPHIHISAEFADIKSFNKTSGENTASFDTAPMPHSLPANPLLRIIWTDFVLKKVPAGEWSLNDPRGKYLEFLKGRFQTVENLNREYQTSYGGFAEVAMPFMLEDYAQFMKNKERMRWNYFTANYRKVVEYLMTKGRAVSVTLILVALSIFAALTVNPLAAYALSRGRQSVANKFLIFFLATMAFPAEIAMIPGFLLIRDLGLLNTMFALILPGLANGYSIFLLKGFFDSIPRELYEAADVDGAGEFIKFYHITFPMSKPILAVIALGAFNAAYGGFMWAFLTCQDKNMWTIMVWLYDFQSRSTNQGMTMAALVLASMPTLLVFIFCQNIIMRGIVVPTMK